MPVYAAILHKPADAEREREWGRGRGRERERERETSNLPAQRHLANKPVIVAVGRRVAYCSKHLPSNATMTN